MNGPGQFLGPFVVDTQGRDDVWSDDISDVASRAHQQEDAAEAAAWAATKADKGWTEGLPASASDADKSDYAIGVRREQARKARAYEGSLTKRAAGTLFLTGSETWHGTNAVLNGKLSVVGSHASAIDVRGGTLGGSGTVGDSINVGDGVLRPGVTADEAAQITGASGAAGNVLHVGGNATIGKQGRVAVTISGDRDYTSVRAAGNLVLDGELDLNVRGKLTPGTVSTPITLVAPLRLMGSSAPTPAATSPGCRSASLRQAYHGGAPVTTRAARRGLGGAPRVSRNAGPVEPLQQSTTTHGH
ncbi:hypothetical protein ACIHCX_34970 [Streptomyces sp. NPDC052043]|uniref:hypothetical protein n=1 Tax=Streptomyces sp. NPDC052043 TaxID=3365684 RepID=UPI0037D0A915